MEVRLDPVSDYLAESFVWRPSWTSNLFMVRSLSPLMSLIHRTVPVVIFKVLMNFNPRAALIGEKLDHIVLFNHMNKVLLAGPIR
jgi:hypothetical protein